MLFAIWRAKKCKIVYICCDLQFGELKSAKQLIFTLLFAIRRALEPQPQKPQNLSLQPRHIVVFYFCFFLVQLRELSPVYRGSLGAGAPGDSRGQKCKIAYIYCAFCNSDSYKMQNSIYLLCFLQFGELTSAKQLIFSVLFVIWRGKKCKQKNIFAAFCDLELRSAKQFIFTVLFAIWRANKCKIAYIYCAFCNLQS